MSRQPTEKGVNARRVPTQQRARARVERVLGAAEELILDSGINNLKINDVAERAAVPIGSVYEYFSGRDDIIYALAERHHRVIEAATQRLFENVNSIDSLLDAVAAAIAGAWSYVRDNPGYRELLCGVQASEGLRELDWGDTLTNARILASAAAPLLPRIDPDEILALCLIICDAAGSTARLAMHFDTYGQKLHSAFGDMARNQFIELVRRNANS